MSVAAIEALLLALQLGNAVLEQIELAENEVLPDSVRAALKAERKKYNAQLDRLDTMVWRGY